MGQQEDPKETQSAALQQKGQFTNSCRNTAQIRGTVPRKKVGSPTKQDRSSAARSAKLELCSRPHAGRCTVPPVVISKYF